MGDDMPERLWVRHETAYLGPDTVEAHLEPDHYPEDWTEYAQADDGDALADAEAERDAALARVAALEEALRECADLADLALDAASWRKDAKREAQEQVRRARALLAPSAEEAGDA